MLLPASGHKRISHYPRCQPIPARRCLARQQHPLTFLELHPSHFQVWIYSSTPSKPLAEFGIPSVPIHLCCQHQLAPRRCRGPNAQDRGGCACDPTELFCFFKCSPSPARRCAAPKAFLHHASRKGSGAHLAALHRAASVRHLGGHSKSRCLVTIWLFWSVDDIKSKLESSLIVKSIVS